MLVGCITIRNCNRIVKKSNTYRSTTRIDCLRLSYTERVEGWAADILELPAPYNNIAICTGYAPFGTKNKNARKVCERWEKLYYNYDFNQRKRMIKRFARELSKTINN